MGRKCFPSIQDSGRYSNVNEPIHVHHDALVICSTNVNKDLTETKERSSINHLKNIWLHWWHAWACARDIRCKAPPHSRLLHWQIHARAVSEITELSRVLRQRPFFIFYYRAEE